MRPSSQALMLVALGSGSYLALGQLVGNLYPFSSLAMFAREHSTLPTRVLAVDARGAAHELDEYRTWDCPAPISGELLGRDRCASFGNYVEIPQSDAIALDYLQRHPGPGGEPVALVRRVWTLTDEGGPPPSRDCVLLRCRAVRE